MSYPVLINGTLIGASDPPNTSDGVDLVVVEPHSAINLMYQPGAFALEIGDTAVVVGIGPEGIDLVSHEPSLMIADRDLRPDGIDLVTGGIHHYDITLVQAPPAPVFEFGDSRVKSGNDVELKPDGLDLITSGFHGLLRAQLPSAQLLVQTNPGAVLELGAPAITGRALMQQSAVDVAMQLGDPGLRLGVLAGGSSAVLEVGDARASITLVQPGQAAVFEIGTPGIALALLAEGIDLVSGWGLHSLSAGGATLQAGGASGLLDVGEPGLPRTTLLMRQHFPLELGTPSVTRGPSC